MPLFTSMGGKFIPAIITLSHCYDRYDWDRIFNENMWMGMVFKNIEYMIGGVFKILAVCLYPKVWKRHPPPQPPGMQNYQMIQPVLPPCSAEKLWRLSRARENWLWLCSTGDEEYRWGRRFKRDIISTNEYFILVSQSTCFTNWWFQCTMNITYT